MSKLLCPQCVENGTTSRVYPTGSTSTLMGGRPEWWDEEGNHHYHEINVPHDGYRCEKGHAWTVKRQSICPTCGIL